MKVMILDEKKGYQIKDIPNEYEALKDVVGGYIEAVYLPHDIVLVVNEEGKLMDLPVVAYLEWDGELADTVNGKCFFCGVDNVNFTGLSNEQIKWLVMEMNNFIFTTNGVFPVITWR